MDSSSFYWTHFLESMLKLSGTEPSSLENIPPQEAGCGLNDVAWDCRKASRGGKNPESSVFQVAFGPFKGFCVVWSDEHSGQAVASLIQGAAIAILGELGEDWSGAGNVFEGSNLQVTAQGCGFAWRDRRCCGLSGCLWLFWGGNDFRLAVLRWCARGGL